MRILLVTPIYPPNIGGPATYTQNLKKELTSTHNVTVVCFGEKTKNSEEFQVFRIPTLGSVFFRQLRLLRIVWERAKKSDLVFSQDSFVVGLASVLAAKLQNKPLIIKFVGDVIWETSRFEKKTKLSLEGFYKKRLSFKDKIKFILQKKILDSGSVIITPSADLKKFLVNNYQIKKKKIKVIYNGVKIKKRKKISKQRNSVIFVGRLVSWKNIDEIIKAIAKFPKLKLNIVGDGPEEKNLKKLTNKLNLDKKVKFLGKLKEEEVEKVLQKTNIFVLNSSYEGLPHVLLEAAVNKVVVLAPRLPGICEIFDNNEVYFFSPGNKEDLESCLFEIIQKPNLAKIKTKRAYEKIINFFSWEKTFVETENVLCSMLKEEN